MSPTTLPRSWLQRAPLRVTLVVALVMLAAVGLTVTGAVVTTQLRGYLVDQVDQDLAQIAQRRPTPDDLGGGRGGDTPFETSRDEYLGFAAADGSALQGTTTNNASPPRLTAAELVGSGAGPFTAPSTGRGPDWRVIATSDRFVTQSGDPIIVVRGVSLGDVNRHHPATGSRRAAGRRRRPAPVGRARLRRGPHLAATVGGGRDHRGGDRGGRPDPPGAGG